MRRGSGDAVRARHTAVERQRLAQRFRRPLQVLRFLRHPFERARRSHQRFAARPIPIRKLHRLAPPGAEAEMLRLLQRVGAAIDVLETVDERAHETEERVGPVRPQLRRLAKRRDGIGELLSRRRAVCRRTFRASPLMRCRCPSQ